MTAIELKKGEHLVRKGESTKAIYIVIKGAVHVVTTYNQMTLGSGSVVGFTLGFSDQYVCDYVAAEDSLIVLPYLTPFLTYLNQDCYLCLFKSAIPHIHAAVPEHLIESCPQGILTDALLQHNLQKATAAGAANHFSGNQILNAQENLIDTGIGASLINFLAESPMLI